MQSLDDDCDLLFCLNSLRWCCESWIRAPRSANGCAATALGRHVRAASHLHVYTCACVCVCLCVCVRVCACVSVTVHGCDRCTVIAIMQASKQACMHHSIIECMQEGWCVCARDHTRMHVWRFPVWLCLIVYIQRDEILVYIRLVSMSCFPV